MMSISWYSEVCPIVPSGIHSMMISDEQIIQDGEVEWVYLSHQLQKEGEAEEAGRHNVNSER